MSHLRVWLLFGMTVAVLTAAGSAQAATNSLTASTYPYFASQQTHVTLGSFSAGASQTVTTAAANSNFVFAGWTVSDSTASVSPALSATATFTMGQRACLLTAVFNIPINRVPLNISGGFNMDAIVGPIVASQGNKAGKGPRAWLGNEPQGLALLSFAGWNGFWGNYGNAFICDTSSNDGLSYPSYTYSVAGGTGTAYTGSQALPENGILTSIVDGRTYLIASASGNTLLPGDWVDSAYNSTMSGNWIDSASTVIYGPTTYTASNPKLNTMVVGQDTYFAPSWSVSSLTASFTPGNYVDINFAMKGGEYFGSGNWLFFGAGGAQIWANYDSGPSQQLYNFVKGEMTNTNVNAANFNILYTCGYSAIDGTTNFGPSKYLNLLYEFSSPKTLDPTRQLTSISLSYVAASGYPGSQLAVFGATVNPFVPGYIQLTTSVISGPFGAEGTIAPAYAYVAPGTSLTVVATPATGYSFVNWSITDTSAIIANSTASSTTLTTGSNACLLTASFTPQARTLAVTTSGGGTATVPIGPYYFGQYVPVTVTPSPGWQLSTETLSNCTYVGNSLLLSGSATARFNFTAITYSVSGMAAPTAGGTVSPVSTTATYGQVINIAATAANHYTFNTWAFDANVIYDLADLTAASTTVAVIGNTVFSAVFPAENFSGSELDLPSTGGSITLTPGGPFTYGQIVVLRATADLGFHFSYWTVTGSSTLSDSTAITTSLTVYEAFTLTAYFTADTLTASVTLDNAWVYQNPPAATLNRLFRPMIITVQDTWPDTSYTAVVTQSGSGVVVPSLTFVAADGTGAVTPTSSFVFSGSSATIYLVGGPRQADGVAGTGSCTVTVQITGNSSDLATTTTQALLVVRRFGDINGNRSVTTADRVQLRKRFNGLSTPNQTTADFDLDGDGAVTANDLSLLTAVLNHRALPPIPLTLTTAVNPPGYGTVTVTPSQATYFYGDQPAIATVPSSNYVFSNWSATGGTVANPAAASTSLTVQSNATLTANFIPVYTLTMNVGPQGAAIVTPSQANYPFGQQVTITMSTITAGNVLDHWVLSGAGTLSNSAALSTLLTISAGNATITAVYTSGSYVNNLSPAASDNNVGSLAAPFKTIGKALSKVRAAQAQSIVIQQGVYHESPGATVTGAAGNPITLKSNPGDRVVITGADVIPQATNSWMLCDSITASGNPNCAHIYYTDVNWSGCINGWAPFRFSEDEQPLLLAQTPTSGPPSYWAITGSGTSAGTLIDTVHLTQSDSTYWMGANLFYFQPYGAWGGYTITGYDPATSKLTYSPSTLGLWLGQGRYFLYGSPKLLGGPGQWAVEALSTTGSFRVWVWPAGNGRPDGHLYQATRWGSTSTWGLLDIAYFAGNPAYYILDGLEVCNSTANGIQVAGSSNVSGSGGNHIVRNCVTHDNDWCGIWGSYNLNGQYIHNLVVQNGVWFGHQYGGEGGCGFNTRGVGWSQTSMNETFQENEIGWNVCDGMYLATCGLNIVGNYIHNNGQFGHCDGIQLCIDSGVVYGNSTTVMNNLFNANGDIMQSNWSVDVQMLNNVALDTLGWGFQSQCLDLIWDHNTIVGLGALDEYPDDPLTITNNLFDMGIPVTATWNSSQPSSFFSDSNLVYEGPGVTTAGLQVVYSGSWMSWSHYLAISGLDAHTITNSSPLMNAAPPYIFYGPGPDLGPNGPGYSASTLYLPTAWEIQATQVGDNIEINGDGVLRQVTNVSLTNSVVTFTPSCAAKLFYDYPIIVNNWKSQICTTKSMDVSLQATSPAKGQAQGGTDIGALNFNVADYMAGKLNGNTKRVLPIWPPAPVTLAGTGWKYMNAGTASALAEGGTYTNPNMTGFQITFGAPLYALSCTNSAAVTVVDNTGTTYPINAATLDSTGTVLTIVLTNGALPRNVSWIEVILNPALLGANGTDPTIGTNGGPVTGVKSVRFTIN